MQIDFIFTFHDLEFVIQKVLLEGARVVPNRKYAHREYAEISDVATAMKALEESKSGFVLHPSFSRLPLEMRYLQKSKTYYILPKNGGPAIDLMCAGVVRKNGREVLGTGYAAIYDTYWDEEKRSNEQVPESMRGFFECIVGVIQESSVIAKAKSRTYFIGRDARSMLDSGVPSVALSTIAPVPTN